MNAGYRQVFTDGRPLPEDPQPSWQGYSSAQVGGRHAGRRTRADSATNVDRLERERASTSAAKVQRANPAARLRAPRDRGHRRRSRRRTRKPWTVTLKQRIARRHRARGRNLPGEREVVSAHEVNGIRTPFQPDRSPPPVPVAKTRMKLRWTGSRFAYHSPRPSPRRMNHRSDKFRLRNRSDLRF